MTSFPLFISCSWVLFCAHSFSSCLSSSDCSHLFSSLLSSSLLFSPLLSSSLLFSPPLSSSHCSALLSSCQLFSACQLISVLHSSQLISSLRVSSQLFPPSFWHFSALLTFSQLVSPSLSSSILFSPRLFSTFWLSSGLLSSPQLFSDRLCKTENSSSTQAHIHRGAATPVRFAGPDCKTPWNYMHRRKKEQQHAPTPMQFSSGKLQKAQHYARAPLQPRATSMQPHRCDLQAPSCKFG